MRELLMGPRVHGVNMNKRFAILVSVALVLGSWGASAEEEPAEIKPTPVTLKMESVHPQEVIAELSTKAGVNIQVWPENLWTQNRGRNGPPTSVSVDVEEKPFWVVMEEICTQMNLFPANMGNNDGVTLQWRGMNSGGIFGKRPTFAGENGTVVASSIQRSHTINLDSDNPTASRTCGINIDGYVDPRLRVMRFSRQPSIEQAEDENGNSVLPADADQRNGSMDETNSSWQLGGIFIPLDYDPEKSHKLAVLKGSIRVSAAGAVEKLEVDDLENAQGTDKTIAGRHIVLDEVKMNEKSFSIKVTISRESMSDEEWRSMFHAIIQGMKVESASGKRMNLGGGGGGSDKQVTYTLSTNWSDEGDKPVKLRWEIPTGFHDVELPFEFKDLTLP